MNMVNLKEYQLTTAVKLLVSMEQDRTYMAISDGENTADFFSVLPEKQEEFLTKLFDLLDSYNDQLEGRIIHQLKPRFSVLGWFVKILKHLINKKS